MVCRLLENVLALGEFVGHLLTVVFLEVSENIRHGVVGGVGCAVADIYKIHLLDRGDDFLHKVMLDSCHLAKNTHFLGVQNLHF